MPSGPYKNLDFVSYCRYNFILNCRQKCIGGGVAFYIKDTIGFTLYDELTVASYSICDVLYWQHNIATQRDYAMRTCALFEI